MKLSKPRVVIIGAGFGGLNAAKALKNANCEVILIDRNNHHLFQPLLYQVATSALSPGDIASPIRTIMRDCKNAQVIMSEVEDIDTITKRVITEDGDIAYDYLIMAPGARHSYFGNKEWEKHAPGLKDLKDALEIRERVLYSFEKAERTYGTKDAKKHMTFVVVGGGPTGVELAGSIAEIAGKTMLPDFPILKNKDIRVILIEGAKNLLNSYPDELTKYTKDALEKLGVEVMLETMVTEVSEKGVQTNNRFIETSNVIWAAGNEASPLLKALNAETGPSGRVKVNKDMSVPGLDDVFVIGDAAYFEGEDGNPIPAVAPAAIQQARYVAENIKKRRSAEERKPFRYNDKGSMATIGRAKAVTFKNKFKLKGFMAWLFWGVTHIMFLIEFRSRMSVMMQWFWYYLSFRPGAHLIIGRGKRDKIDREEKIASRDKSAV